MTTIYIISYFFNVIVLIILHKKGAFAESCESPKALTIGNLLLILLVSCLLFITNAFIIILTLVSYIINNKNNFLFLNKPIIKYNPKPFKL